MDGRIMRHQVADGRTPGEQQVLWWRKWGLPLLATGALVLLPLSPMITPALAACPPEDLECLAESVESTTKPVQESIEESIEETTDPVVTEVTDTLEPILNPDDGSGAPDPGGDGEPSPGGPTEGGGSGSVAPGSSGQVPKASGSLPVVSLSPALLERKLAAGAAEPVSQNVAAFSPEATRGLFARIADGIGEAARQAGFPLALAALVVAFLMIQDRVDRKDPKLALAPREPDDVVFR